MGKVLVFNIRNTQEEYAESMRLINELNRNCSVTANSLLHVGYIDCNKNSNRYTIASEIAQKEYGEISINGDIQFEKNEEIICYCFFINMEKEDDIVNLMYYYLIKQLVPNTIAILTTPGLEYDMKVSAYLSFELNKDKNTIFIKTDPAQIHIYGMVHRLPGSSMKEKKEWRLTKFLPLIEVTTETFEFLEGTVESAKKLVVEQEKSKRGSWKKKLLDTCDGLVTQYSRSKNEKWISEKEFIDITKNVSVLTYILFCSFRNHCVNRRKEFDIVKIEQELSDARDIAEGCLQVLENIIQHSQNKKGYFSFRIHDNQKNNIYLQNNYKEYINKSGYDTFLEMFIADYFYSLENPKNVNILGMQFVNNLEDRSKQDERLLPFVEKYGELEVKSFFENEIWKEYNSVSDNIIEHYGLQLFDKIVSSCDGCFTLISTDSYDYDNSQYYCSTASIDNKHTIVLPGTQYRVLLPVKERSFNQGYSGLDFYNYPKTAMLKPIENDITVDNINLENQIINIDKDIKKGKKYNELSKMEREKFRKIELIEHLNSFIYAEIYKRINSKNVYVLHFLFDKIKGARLIEIVFKACLKAVINIREEIGSEIKIYLGFGKLTKEFISEFCYLMGIYYYKAEKSLLMKNTEMYFWEDSYCEDLLITGENLKIAHNLILKRAVMRGIYPHWIPFINYIWKKCYVQGVSNATNVEMTTLPYDVIVKYESKTIFENVVTKILEKPMEQSELGCLIKHTHVQLASKIHISEFYNGQILFLNNYFTNYFAYLIIEKIKNIIATQSYCCRKNVVLIGYEGYSEILMVKTSELLKTYVKDKELENKYSVKPYLVGEMKDGKIIFRSAMGRLGEARIDLCESYNDENNIFIFVVPISSTLTTFERIYFELEKALHITLDKKNIAVNFALIIARDIYKEKCNFKKSNLRNSMTDEEGEYWDVKKGNLITTKNRKLEVEYFVEVCSNWERATSCSQCFPQKNIDEKPLIKTDTAGLAPLTQLGKKRKWKNDGNVSDVNILRVKKLSDVLTYNHIERGGNHYLYYFDTNTFFYENKEKIDEWLKQLKSNGNNERQYSFIVAPLHETNAGFTEEVNHIIFDNTAHIIRIEFGRSYRSNFMVQFSYLRILYNNLLDAANTMNEKAEINFYFVDDEIISGKTVLRAKSLLAGLFKDLNGEESIAVNIFKKIYVLVDRLSDSSKQSYINNIKDYESFVKFNISAIQNHDDFCFMCRLVKNANGYKFMSATNKMDESWRKIEEKFKIKNYAWVEQHPEARQDKYKSRMLAAHYAEAEILMLGENAGVEEYFQTMIKKLIYKRLYKRGSTIKCTENNQNIFTSYIKILSRPFFAYRKDVKEAALHLVVLFMEIFLGRNGEIIYEELKMFWNTDELNIELELQALSNFIGEWKRKRDKAAYTLLLDLMEQLADMESSYIIRRDNMKRIFTVCNEILSAYCKDDYMLKMLKNDFELKYAIYIKQITNEDADETKSLWVENLCLFGRELNSSILNDDKEFCELYGYKSSFGQKILIENTKIIYDGVKYLAENLNEQKKLCDEKSKLFYGRFITKDNNGSESLYKIAMDNTKTEISKASGVQLKYFNEVLDFYSAGETIGFSVLFYILMFWLKTEDIQFDYFYKELYQLIVGITGAEVQILMIPNSNQEKMDYIYLDEPCIIYDKNKERNRTRVIKLEDKPLVESQYLRELIYEFDTYYINPDGKQAIIKYSISSKHKNEKDYIYVVLKYDKKQEMRNLLFRLRLVLLCRSRTVTRMKRDFNNNLFQSLWQTKKHNLLLEHFKNVSHNNPKRDVTRKTIDCIRRIDEYCRGEETQERDIGFRVYKALLLKMLADNNISSLYHEILSERLVNDYVFLCDFSSGPIFRDINDLKYSMRREKEDQDNEEWFNDTIDFSNVEIDQNVYNSKMYYLAPNVNRPQLIVISLIQNAYRHGNNKENIHLYRESGLQDGKKSFDYLCISNGVDVEDSDSYKNRIREHIEKPISARKLTLHDAQREGITLFSTDGYCTKILEKLGFQKNQNNAIKFDVSNKKIVFKIPILKGE